MLCRLSESQVYDVIVTDGKILTPSSTLYKLSLCKARWIGDLVFLLVIKGLSIPGWIVTDFYEWSDHVIFMLSIWCPNLNAVTVEKNDMKWWQKMTWFKV